MKIHLPPVALLLLSACVQVPAESSPGDLHELVQLYGAGAGYEVICEQDTVALLESVAVSRVDGEGGRVLRLERAVGVRDATNGSYEVIALQHAAAADLAEALSALVASASSSAEAARVSVLADTRTNSLLVSAPEETLAQLRELIARLDREV
jgi:hypothetical protein